MANRNWVSGGKIYSQHVQPVLLDCSFLVTPSDATGVSEFHGSAIADVFMQTSTTPSAGNPDPANGYIFVQLDNGYNKLLGLDMSAEAPVTGDEIAVNASGLVTANELYVISTVGTTTTAQWQSIGVPSSVTPAVGVPFIANAVAADPGTSGTGKVKAVGVTNMDEVQIAGNANLSVVASGAYGGYLILKCMKASVLATPTTGTRIKLNIYLSNSADNGIAY